MKPKYTRLLLIVSMLVLTASCNKYLEEKRDQSLSVPSTLDDLQEILNSGSINTAALPISEFSSDNHFFTTGSWNSTVVSNRNLYIWNADDGPGYLEASWQAPYSGIYTANFILENLEKIPVSAANKTRADNIKGTALYFRGFYFHQLADLFCKPYSNTAATDPGIVLRLTSSVGVKSNRATVKETFDQIISDVKNAIDLLPGAASFKTQPTTVAAKALLARIYLSMSNYTNAETYARQALAEQNTLLDYNTLLPSSAPQLPAPANNPEILLITSAIFPLFEPQYNNVDTILYASYHPNDLRKTVFFSPNGNTGKWRGNYAVLFDGIAHGIFTGPAVDELYLIRAECMARAGNTDGAMSDLNVLLAKRWKTGTFTNLTATNAADALTQVLSERRKELVFRNLRWSDIRRFNLESSNITLRRFINGTIFTLPPNDLRWVMLIPAREIIYSGIQQNPR